MSDDCNNMYCDIDIFVPMPSDKGLWNHIVLTIQLIQVSHRRYSIMSF